MKRSQLLGVVVVLLCVAAGRAEDWPCFRGPTGQGISSEKGLPTQWSATENVAWKTKIPGEGWSSPIVYGDRLFVTTATDKGTICRVLCLDRKGGKVLWDRKVFDQKPGSRRPKNSFATPTPVADADHVYAVFSGGGVVALSHEGKVAWTNLDVKFSSVHGLGASPLLYKELLVMPYDGTDPRNGNIGWKEPWE